MKWNEWKINFVNSNSNCSNNNNEKNVAKVAWPANFTPYLILTRCPPAVQSLLVFLSVPFALCGFCSVLCVCVRCSQFSVLSFGVCSVCKLLSVISHTILPRVCLSLIVYRAIVVGHLHSTRTRAKAGALLFVLRPIKLTVKAWSRQQESESEIIG